ncbi:MAG: Gfo/Idh/MocA family oxidoreductase [Thermoguttaceae bacterium]|nr:Gfo/Idh/MocA family oxidoreductase [Thermoguttaceae bacterium]
MSKLSRRHFLSRTALGAGILAAGSALSAQEQPIAGFDQTETDIDKNSVWQQKSDRKIRMGIVGFGVCQFGAAFGLQNHPNVEVVAVSDLIPERRAGLAKACRCEKTYESLEEMIKDDTIEAIFVATDAPSHADHCIKVLESGKHVATAVPAVWGDLDMAFKLYETVKKNAGLNYMMFETSTFHDAVYATRQLYNAGVLGKMIYSEGEYYHHFPTNLDSYKGWRDGLPPQWYPTHSNAYYVCATGGHSFTEVSCMGHKSQYAHFQPQNNPYGNPFGTEVALLRTCEGGMARMAVSWDTPGWGGEVGRNRAEKGSYNTEFQPMDDAVKEAASKVNLKKPALPPQVDPGGHGGSHGYLGNEFVEAILENRTPLVNIAWALNMTVAGIVSHQSALKDGELMKIPQFEF